MHILFLFLSLASAHAARAGCEPAILGFGESTPSFIYPSGFVPGASTDPKFFVAERGEDTDQIKASLLETSLSDTIAWLHARVYRNLIIKKVNDEHRGLGRSVVKSADADLVLFGSHLVSRNLDRALLPYFKELRAISMDILLGDTGENSALILQSKLAAMSLSLPELDPYQQEILQSIAPVSLLGPNLLTPAKVAAIRRDLHAFFATDLRPAADSIKLFIVTEMIHHALVETMLNDSAQAYVSLLCDLLPESYELPIKYSNSALRDSARLSLENLLKRRDVKLSAEQFNLVNGLIAKLKNRILI